jgi:hypothetical protein
MSHAQAPQAQAQSTVAQTSKAHHMAKQQRKNPAAVKLGRLGGLKGGDARAVKLSRQRKRAIARKAALVRWGKAES